MNAATKTLVTRFFNECELTSAMLDVEVTPYVDSEAKKCGLSFPSKATYFFHDRINFNGVEEGIAFLANVNLIARMGRSQRRGL